MLLIYSLANAQEPVFNSFININSTFDHDTVLSPFYSQNIYGIGITGSIHFENDTGMVRIIARDASNYEFMVYETYTTIDTVWDFTFIKKCEETCFLNGFVPDELEVQISYASVTISKIDLATSFVDNADSLQFLSKTNSDNIKITKLNNYIWHHNMFWSAAETRLSELLYRDKKSIFGEKYSIFGYEYYKSGIFEYLDTKTVDDEWNHRTYGIVDNFDWRKKHNANDPNSYYFDGNPDSDETGNGWMTAIKCQIGCWHDQPEPGYWECLSDPSQCTGEWRSTGACAGFAGIGQIEALSNIYFNRHFDFDLSEQQSASGPSQGPCGETIEGANISNVLVDCVSPGIVDEICFPFEGSDIPCTLCTSPSNIVSIENYEMWEEITTPEEIKRKLIEYGPLGIEGTLASAPSHAAVLVGFDIIDEGDLFWCYSPQGWGWHEVTFGDPYIGHTYYVLKNSYGPFGENDLDYSYFFLVDAPTKVYGIQTPVYSTLKSQGERLIADLDQDGYCNWGIGDKPVITPPNNCPELMDGNDNDPGLGPMDENGFCSVIDNYYTSFEQGFDLWSQVNTDGFDWLLHSGPSANIPDQLQGAQDGEYYAYFYTNANTSNSSSLLVSPLIEYSGCTYYLDFWFHRYFPYAYGDVYLQLRGSNDGGLTWDDDPIWYVSGISNENNWQYVHLIIPGNYNKLRFEGITGANGDIYDLGLDNISISKMEEPFVVTGTYNFSGETSFCDDIIIESGGIFNVKFSSVLHIAPTKKIIVKRGGSLNIESGSTITGVDGNFWKGIELWGNKNAPQTVQYQGLVSINGGATISNATCGIRTIRIDDSDQYNPDYSGGIVHSINGIFLNNKTAVEFFSYNFEESSSYFKKKYSV